MALLSGRPMENVSFHFVIIHRVFFIAAVVQGTNMRTFYDGQQEQSQLIMYRDFTWHKQQQ